MSEAVERLKAVAAGAAIEDVYGAEWCIFPGHAFRDDLRAALSLPGEISVPEPAPLASASVVSLADLDDVAAVLAPFAAVSLKAGDKAKDESCWCGQDGAVIRYADLRRAARLYAATVTERICRGAAVEAEGIAAALVRAAKPIWRPNEEQVRHMVSRFLAWRLPENFHPDAGISFKPDFNEHTAHPMKHQPTGTNLFDATQATAMVRHMLADLPAPPPRPSGEEIARPASEYHEDMGCVLWWRFPVEEPPYVGSPNDTKWPGYHTHWTPIAAPNFSPEAARG